MKNYLLFTIWPLLALGCHSRHRSFKELFENQHDSLLSFHDNTNVLGVSLSQHRMIFLFTISCGYYFPIEYNGDKAVVYWTPEADCITDQEFNKRFGQGSAPVKGKPFAQFQLVDDTLLRVTYYNPDWIREINSIDTMFHSIYTLQK